MRFSRGAKYNALELSDHYHRASFPHAFGGNPEENALVTPLASMKGSDRTLFDVALHLR